MSQRVASVYPVPVTASWSVRLPDRYCRIGVSRGPPRGQRGYRMYLPLAPGPWLKSASQTEFCDLYTEQLNHLDAERVVRDLANLAGDKLPALLCFEPPPPDPAWCHRSLIAGWLFDQLGIAVCEVGHEHCGSGWDHPKLPRSFSPPGGNNHSRAQG